MPNLSTMECASKDYSNSLGKKKKGYLSLLLIIISPQRAGAFSRDFTKKMALRAELISGL